MELIVEATGIAHRVPAGISSPQRRGSCLAVGALGTCSFTDNQALLGPDERSVLPIHLVIEATGIT